MSETKLEPIEALGNALVQQHPDFLCSLLSAALHAVMDSDVDAICGAAYRERAETRVNSRNGVRERDLETRVGTVNLAIPKLRKGSYFPGFLQPRKRWEKAFVNVVAEAVCVGRFDSQRRRPRRVHGRGRHVEE